MSGREKAKPTVLFDDACPVCRTGVAALTRVCGEAAAAAPLPAEPDGAAPAEMKLVMPGGAVYGGAEAIVRTLALRPIFRPVAWLYYLPGVRQLADASYRFLAAHRPRDPSARAVSTRR